MKNKLLYKNKQIWIKDSFKSQLSIPNLPNLFVYIIQNATNVYISFKEPPQCFNKYNSTITKLILIDNKININLNLNTCYLKYNIFETATKTIKIIGVEDK